MTDLQPDVPPRWSTGLALVSAFLAYSALAVLVTFPLILDLSSRLPKDLGDPLLSASILWWNAHVMPLTERWWDGFGFYPAPGMMAFSEHFLGASLIASPLQWLGCSPITAYNLTFLISFPLCAVAAHALALTLTKRHDAAIVCGLAYGFNPYRVAHVEHLELLMGFGMPAALVALHRYADTRRARWLAALAASLIIQALCASYYALFFTVFVGLWVLWFMRPHAWRAMLAIITTSAASVLFVSPIVFGYSRIHQSYNWRRDLTEEILRFSADLSSFVTASPLSAVWGWTAFLNGGERQLFPGLTITALAVAGVALVARSRTIARDRVVIVSKVAWAVSALFAAVAIGARVLGPWRVDWGWLRVSVAVPYKPLSLAAAFAIIAVASDKRMREAFRKRSTFAFYVVAALILFLCSLGPHPTLLGQPFLYEPPYAWLMRLPIFGDTVRVPARFAMLGILALAVAGSLAFNRVRSQRQQRIALLLVVLPGILVDGWMSALPLPAVPQTRFHIAPGDERPAAVMELPLGDVWRDTAAMYRATLHGTRVVNGYDGFEPIYYQALRRALTDRDPTVLDTLASAGPLLIAADNERESGPPWASFLSSDPVIRRLKADGRRTLFWLPLKRRHLTQQRCASSPFAVTAAFDAQGPVDVAALTDQNPATRWITSHAQRAGDVLVLDFGQVHEVCQIVVSLGSAAVLYPGTLGVATSVDGVAWEAGFVGTMGGSAVRAALRNPRDARISVLLSGNAARFLRLRVERSHPLYPWAVADVLVSGWR
jgi:hypothetical protein